MPPTTEVRSCPKCNQPAVTLVFEWQHTTFGGATGQTTRDYRCQNCGAKFTVHARARQIGLWVVGVILLFGGCVPGLVVLFFAWMRSQVEASIPPAIGAPVPPIRYKGGPPVRRCGACQAVAVAIRITRSTHNGIPVGTEYEYRCQGCGRQFVIESPWGYTVSLLGILLLGGIGASLLVYGNTYGWRFGGGGLISLIAVGLAVQMLRRISNRFRNPVMTSGVVPT